MDLAYAIVGIGLSFFAFLLVLIGIAELQGGEWVLISQGLVQFLPWVVVGTLAFFILYAVMGKR